MSEPKDSRELSLIVSGFVFWFAALMLVGAVLTQSRGMTDFRSYYAAGELVRHDPHQLYSAAAQMSGQAEVGSGSFFPWAHLPAEALLMAPLTLLPFSLAFLVWKIVNLLLLLVAGYALRPYISGFSALAIALCPAAIGLGAGQDHIITLLIFVFGFLSLKQGNEFRAGSILGLGLIRFGVTAPLLLFFLVARRWRFLAGSAVSGSALVLISFLVVGRGFVQQYLGICKLLATYHSSPDAARMSTVRGFVTAMFPHSPHVYLAVIALSGAMLMWGLHRWVAWNGDPDRVDVLFSLALVLSLLIDYQGYIYNMTSLVIPALVLVRLHPMASSFLWVCAAATIAITLSAQAHFGLLPPLYLGIAVWISREPDPIRVMSGPSDSLHPSAAWRAVNR